MSRDEEERKNKKKERREKFAPLPYSRTNRQKANQMETESGRFHR